MVECLSPKETTKVRSLVPPHLVFVSESVSLEKQAFRIEPCLPVDREASIGAA